MTSDHVIVASNLNFHIVELNVLLEKVACHSPSLCTRAFFFELTGRWIWEGARISLEKSSQKKRLRLPLSLAKNQIYMLSKLILPLQLISKRKVEEEEGEEETTGLEMLNDDC